MDIAPLVAAFLTPSGAALPPDHPTTASLDVREDVRAAAATLRASLREVGFAYVAMPPHVVALADALDAAARDFFAMPLADKLAIDMDRSGAAWRGYFPVGRELTSGVPDIKEGLYLGTEDVAVDEGGAAGGDTGRHSKPLHGVNQWPASVPALRPAVMRYMEATTALGHVLMRGIALGLGLPSDYFQCRLTAQPLILFRIFAYPPTTTMPTTAAGAAATADAGVEAPVERWGVGEHTDYGVLTLLRQDESGGLEVRSRRGEWVAAPPRPGTLVINIGDMLERMTHGYLRSTPHRVRVPRHLPGGRSRISFPLFFDPGFDVEVAPLPMEALVVGAPGFAELAAAIARGDADASARERWDRASVHAFRGRYGAYVMSKVARVFPHLFAEAIGGDGAAPAAATTAVAETP